MRRERINQLEQGNSIEMDKGIWVAIGFKEFEPYLNTMENTPASSNSELLKDGTERMKISTRQYAKRQTQYVKHKIWPLFDDGEDRDLFQVLDTSDPGEWGQAVSRPAKSLVQAYLTKSPMNNHSNTTTNDAGFIRRAPQARNTYSCKMCNIIATSEASWESHVKGEGTERPFGNALRCSMKLSQMAGGSWCLIILLKLHDCRFTINIFPRDANDQ